MKLITSTTNTHTWVDMATKRGLQIMKLLWLLVVVAVCGSNHAFAETYYFHNDHLGTPQALTSDSQQVVWRGDYQPFGDVSESASSVKQNIRFPGQYHDKETDNHYNYFRDYSPSTGRYLESDPVGLMAGLNTYTYVAANPLGYSDPYGLFGWKDMPLIPQGIVDFTSGFGDTISIGATDWIRDQLNTNGVVNQCSGDYRGGEWAGIAYGFVAGGVAGLRAAGSRGFGKEFSHWIPNRAGGPRSLWNGNFVTTRIHALSDPYRYRFMPKTWKAGNPIWSAWKRQLVRLPNWMKGSAIGGSIATGGSMAGNDCDC